MTSLPKIKVSLTPSLIGPVNKWVDQLNNSTLLTSQDAVVKSGVLEISPFDLDELIQVSSTDESSEIDAKRLKRLAEDAMHGAIRRAKTQFTRKNLKSALEDLQSAEAGSRVSQNLNHDERQEKTVEPFPLVN